MLSLLEQLTAPAPAASADALACQLCAHRCVLRPGKVGICGAIVHIGNRLHSQAAGRPIALHVDPVERKPLYHVLCGARVLSLGTLGCNMTCDFCQNWRISQTRPTDIPSNEIVAPHEVVAAARAQGCEGLAFTYNEPTIYLDYAAAIMRLAKQAGLLTAFKTNGYLTPEAIDALANEGLLDAANVDLKGFDDSYYRRVCGARLQPVCDAIGHLHRRGVWVEVTTLLIPGVNDSNTELAALTGFLASVSRDIPWHVWRFHPDYHMVNVSWTHLDDIARAVEIGYTAGLRYVYTSNLPGDPRQHTRCPSCGAVLIQRMGNATTAVQLRKGACGECGWVLPGIFNGHKVII